MKNTNTLSQLRCVVCEKNTDYACPEEKVSLCSNNLCVDVYHLNGGMLSRRSRKPKVCTITTKKVEDIPSNDNSERARYDDGNKILKLFYDVDSMNQELTRPFITKMGNNHFLIYDDLKIRYNRFQEHIKSLVLHNFITGRIENHKNIDFNFPLDHLLSEDERKIFSTRCAVEDENVPEFIFDLTVKNMKEGTGQYDFAIVITRILISYPWGVVQ
jgi:hypothetical protein